LLLLVILFWAIDREKRMEEKWQCGGGGRGVDERSVGSLRLFRDTGKHMGNGEWRTLFVVVPKERNKKKIFLE
jgi:hypothetical protein